MKRVFNYLLSIACSRVFLSQDWLPTVQLVLQADWQLLLHSPQPEAWSALFRQGLLTVMILLIGKTPLHLLRETADSFTVFYYTTNRI